MNDVHYMSDTDGWNTPQRIINLVIDCLGQIDLDPCSNTGIPNIPAIKHLTKQDDGLCYYWRGTVYVNPPYGRAIGDWTNLLIAQYTRGITTEAIALLPARPDTDWFEPLFNYPLCFVHGRLKFGNAKNSAPFPSVLVYFGKNEQRFIDVFSSVGTVCKMWKSHE